MADALRRRVQADIKWDDKAVVVDEKPGESSWLHRREDVIHQALEDGDRETLQRVSALPGGFGSSELRREVWPFLLRVKHFFPDSVDEGGAVKDEQESKPEADRPDSDSKKDVTPDVQRTSSPRDTAQEAHKDEGQVLLDTKRSFVVYPKDIPPGSKQIMQDDLQYLIVHVLRRHPKLQYFQGFHDIMSVLYLTFIPVPIPPPRSRSSSRRSSSRRSFERNAGLGSQPPARPGSPPGEVVKNEHDPAAETAREAEKTEKTERDDEERGRGRDRVREIKAEEGGQAVRNRDTPEWTTLLHCAEVVSLCLVRDAMGHGMEPMMGYLKILQRLLRAADPQLARFSASLSPVPTLPFFALSWVLCLFSHDIDTLEPIQRLFDFLLARNPISAIYLAVAILVAKKDQMFQLAKEQGPEARDDPSLLHPLFSRLPPLYPETPEDRVPPTEMPEGRCDENPNPYRPIPISRVLSIAEGLMARYPWDGKVIRGKEILGKGSVVNTYDQEAALPEDDAALTLSKAEELVDKDVILPGASEPDDEPPERTSDKRLRRRFGRRELVALGVVAIGIGIAFYSIRGGVTRPSWKSWWASVVRSWAGRTGSSERLWLHVRGMLGA